MDLPDAEVKFFPSFIPKSEADHFLNRLLEKIIWQQDQIRYYGKMLDLPRLTAWYGETDKPYTYSGIPMSPHPWTEELFDLKQRVEREAGVVFSSVLLNRYRSGSDSVSWHADDEKELGENPVIASISLGAERMFQLKHKRRDDLAKVDILLLHGSLLIMSGPTQHFWKHQIPKTSRNLKDRINLTFRVIK